MPLARSSFSISLRKMNICCSACRLEKLPLALMNICSTTGSVDSAEGPRDLLSTGTRLQASRSWPTFCTTLSMIVRLLWRRASLRGRYTWPTAYSSRAGKRMFCSSMSAWCRKPSGMPTRMPAPSPVLDSQPHAPLCSMRVSIFSESITHLRVGFLSSSPTNPTPHASLSSSGLKRPAASGTAVCALLLTSRSTRGCEGADVFFRDPLGGRQGRGSPPA
mmetsp:Transcript_4606/g.12577  ORF Transcript_4606/g.12577 Transcript_4606/m.12577 type:complete len:219 (+) Transcript_4606:6479-7135(+)